MFSIIVKTKLIQKTEIKFISSKLSKDGKTITIKAGKKQDKHLSDIEELDINSFTGEITIAKTESTIPGELDLKQAQ